MEISHEKQNDERVYMGFWIYLMTDLLMFAVLFAAFIVLRDSTHGNVGIKEIFNPAFVLVETLILLTSSFTIGVSHHFSESKKKARILIPLFLTILLGVAFIGMEFYEFAHLLNEGHSFTESAFLSAFFALVGFHGLHIIVGTLWLVILAFHISHYGIVRSNKRKLLLASTFWHFLDIVWIFIFTIVYLMGGII